MTYLLQLINDARLKSIVNIIEFGNTDHFKKIQTDFPEYDINLLWLISYPHENAPLIIEYIERNYQKYHQILDSRFIKKLAKRGCFISHLWEMILCDLLSAKGSLIPTSAGGPDFLLEEFGKGRIRIEATAPDESQDTSLRSIRPDYSKDKLFELSGNIEDLEKPILLRVFNAITEKSKKSYPQDHPLIIAVNSHKVVGLISNDEYILRRLLFGLGYYTISKSNGGSYKRGLQQNILLNKPNKKAFDVGIFRDTKYSHISGIIYCSQSPMNIIPNKEGTTFSNLTFIPNPNAKLKLDIEFPFFNRMSCDEELYEEKNASSTFISRVWKESGLN